MAQRHLPIKHVEKSSPLVHNEAVMPLRDVAQSDEAKMTEAEQKMRNSIVARIARNSKGSKKKASPALEQSGAPSVVARLSTTTSKRRVGALSESTLLSKRLKLKKDKSSTDVEASKREGSLRGRIGRAKKTSHDNNGDSDRGDAGGLRGRSGRAGEVSKDTTDERPSKRQRPAEVSKVRGKGPSKIKDLTTIVKEKQGKKSKAASLEDDAPPLAKRSVWARKSELTAPVATKGSSKAGTERASAVMKAAKMATAKSMPAKDTPTAKRGAADAELADAKKLPAMLRTAAVQEVRQQTTAVKARSTPLAVETKTDVKVKTLADILKERAQKQSGPGNQLSAAVVKPSAAKSAQTKAPGQSHKVAAAKARPKTRPGALAGAKRAVATAVPKAVRRRSTGKLAPSSVLTITPTVAHDAQPVRRRSQRASTGAESNAAVVKAGKATEDEIGADWEDEFDPLETPKLVEDADLDSALASMTAADDDLDFANSTGEGAALSDDLDDLDDGSDVDIAALLRDD